MTNEKIYTIVEIPAESTYAVDEHGYAQQIVNAVKIDSGQQCIIEYVQEQAQEERATNVTDLTEHASAECEAGDDEYELQDQSLKRRWWTRSQTLALINSVAMHYDALKDPGKKKHVWTTVSAELRQMNISSKECSIKWRNLMRSFLRIKDAKRKQINCSLKFEFFKEMEEVTTRHSNSIYAHSISSMQHVDLSSMETSAGQPEPSGGRAQPPRKRLPNRRLRPRRYLANLRAEWHWRQEEWQQRHEETRERLLLHRKRLELRAQKITLLEKCLHRKEKQRRTALI